MKKYKIEKGVSPGVPKSDVADLINLFEKLTDNDSILLNTREEANNFRTICYNRGYKMIQRKQPDGRIRVWKGAKRS